MGGTKSSFVYKKKKRQERELKACVFPPLPPLFTRVSTNDDTAYGCGGGGSARGLWPDRPAPGASNRGTLQRNTPGDFSPSVQLRTYGLGLT